VRERGSHLVVLLGGGLLAHFDDGGAGAAVLDVNLDRMVAGIGEPRPLSRLSKLMQQAADDRGFCTERSPNGQPLGFGVVVEHGSRVDPGFAVAVKINASDFRPGGFDIDDSAHVVGMLGAEGVDLIEISGGTFESDSGCLGVQPGAPGTSKEAYFAGMAPRLRAMTDVPLALTGGLRSREVMERLLEQGTVDMVGLGRPLIQQPGLSANLLDGTTDGIELQTCPMKGLYELLWWQGQFRRLADGHDFDPDYTTRHNQLDTVSGMLRQIIANLRTTAQDAFAWRP
jgi:hypothetical protein